MYTKQEIQQLIDRDGKNSAFWTVFDSYYKVVGLDAWDKAVNTLWKNVQECVNRAGLDANLDWDFWGQSSFFGLTFEKETNDDIRLIGDFYENDTDAYIKFLNAIEETMWKVTEANEDFEAFCQALNE